MSSCIVFTSEMTASACWSYEMDLLFWKVSVGDERDSKKINERRANEYPVIDILSDTVSLNVNSLCTLFAQPLHTGENMCVHIYLYVNIKQCVKITYSVSLPGCCRTNTAVMNKYWACARERWIYCLQLVSDTLRSLSVVLYVIPLVGISYEQRKKNIRILNDNESENSGVRKENFDRKFEYQKRWQEIVFVSRNQLEFIYI